MPDKRALKKTYQRWGFESIKSQSLVVLFSSALFKSPTATPCDNFPKS